MSLNHSEDYNCLRCDLPVLIALNGIDFARYARFRLAQAVQRDRQRE